MEGIIGVFFDVTELRLKEAALSLANQKLNLLSGITRHDIKNQLTILGGNLMLLKAQMKDPNILHRLEQMEKADQSIRKQLEFTKDYEELGLAVPKWQKMEKLLIDLGQHSGVEALEISERVQHLEVYADPMLGKVFYNLIENSIKYAGKAPKVTIDCIDRGDSLLLIYKDDGQGVPVKRRRRSSRKGSVRVQD